MEKSIAEKLKELHTIKNEIRDAIREKGGPVGGDFSTYAKAIDDLEPAVEGLVEIPEVLDTNFTVTGYIKHFILPDLSNVTDLSYAFYNCSNLTKMDLSNCSTLSSLNNCFYNCESLETVVLPDTDKDINLSFAFYLCRNLRDINIYNVLDNSSRLDNVFVLCSSLDIVDININNTKVTSLFGFLQSASAKSVDINTPNVTSYQQCFNQCSTDSINIHDISKATSVYIMFNTPKLKNLIVYKLPNIDLLEWKLDVCELLTRESLINVLNALPNTSNKKCSLGEVNISKLTDDEIAIAVNKGWTLT